MPSLEEKKRRLIPELLPRHVAIIMDGNGRWAEKKRLDRVKGHQKGLEAVRKVVEVCGELGIKVLTLYAFSKENWLRPKEEVNELMKLLNEMATKADSRMVSEEEFIRAAMEVLQIEERIVRNEIRVLRENGLIYSPRPGFLKPASRSTAF